VRSSRTRPHAAKTWPQTKARPREGRKRPSLWSANPYWRGGCPEAGNDPRCRGAVLSLIRSGQRRVVGRYIKVRTRRTVSSTSPEGRLSFLDRTSSPPLSQATPWPKKRPGYGRLAVPGCVEALNGKISEPAWKTKASWYWSQPRDKMIQPDGPSSVQARGARGCLSRRQHEVHVSKPEAWPSLKKKAAKGVDKKGSAFNLAKRAPSAKF